LGEAEKMMLEVRKEEQKLLQECTSKKNSSDGTRFLSIIEPGLA